MKLLFPVYAKLNTRKPSPVAVNETTSSPLPEKCVGEVARTGATVGAVVALVVFADVAAGAVTGVAAAGCEELHPAIRIIPMHIKTKENIIFFCI